MVLRCHSPVRGLWAVPHEQAGAASHTFLQAVPLSELILRLPSGYQGTVVCCFFPLPGHGSLLWRDKPAAVGWCYLSLLLFDATAPFQVLAWFMDQSCQAPMHPVLDYSLLCFKYGCMSMTGAGPDMSSPVLFRGPGAP